MKGKAYIDAGICRFEATVVTETQDPLGKAQVSIRTECPNLKSLGESFEIEIMDVVQKGCESKTYKRMIEVIPAIHCLSPVVYGVFQKVKIAAGLALTEYVTASLLKE